MAKDWDSVTIPEYEYHLQQKLTGVWVNITHFNDPEKARDRLTRYRRVSTHEFQVVDVNGEPLPW